MQLKFSPNETTFKISLKELTKLIDGETLETTSSFGNETVNITLRQTDSVTRFTTKGCCFDGALNTVVAEQLMAMGRSKEGIDIAGVNLRVDMKGDIRKELAS